MAKKPHHPRPRLACEITAGHVVAGRASDQGEIVETYSARVLPEGTVAPHLTNANVLDAGRLRTAVGDVMAALGARSHDVTAVLPDAAVRISLLDFDTLPEKPQEAEAVVRFRLKKSLPFDVDNAAVSYQSQRINGNVRVIAAVVMKNILEEYEAAIRAAGYEPGVVVPSMLAAIAPVDASRPSLVVKVDTHTTAVAIIDQDQLMLMRTVDNPYGTDVSADQLVENVYPSVMFFQDTYGVAVDRILVGGLTSLDAYRDTLQQHTGARVQELVGASMLGASHSNVPRSMLAGVVGALVS